ncbi:unnamed protein product [Angiostrongylus costaricensis]|uniref:PFK domain-containing protein n=1 Tax=Angiostrongylus costaricensis TaxID=334426 RepID=A0A0R3Q1R9_ANGCS|nr:unnamed protein product [Angiostrongylus costaricensis]
MQGFIAGEYNTFGETASPRAILTGHEATISALAVSAEHGIVLSGSEAVYDENILNEVLSKRDWQNEEDPTEGYELLVEGLKSCAKFASVPQARRSDRIFIITKELLEKRTKLKLGPTGTRST